MKQLSFTWECHKHKGFSEGGTDPALYASHMREHGLKSVTAPRMIRLPKAAPAAKFGKLELNPFKWVYWTEEHKRPGDCRFCQHSSTEHRDGAFGNPGCEQCDCMLTQWAIPPVITTAQRRGQFWSVGSRPHLFWILPFEPAPWEFGRAQPVELRAGAFTQQRPAAEQAQLAA